jgi:hypothetical protein
LPDLYTGKYLLEVVYSDRINKYQIIIIVPDLFLQPLEVPFVPVPFFLFFLQAKIE